MTDIEFTYAHTGHTIDPDAATNAARSCVPTGWHITELTIGRWENETYGYGSSKTTTWRVCVTVWAREGEA